MQRPKGTKDIFGKEQKIKQFVLGVLKDISNVYNFEKIETPIFEDKEVFVRKIGETSDIVQKEMYEFIDKSNRHMVLRPEATASTIRAVVENKLYARPLPLKLYYQGPMFRYENPQKGRQRQFSMYGVEVIADKSPYLDAEIVLMAQTILKAFKIDYKLEINFLGLQKAKENWSIALKNYFEKYKKDLEPISITRLAKNPMRILDDKVESLKPFVQKAPDIFKFYSQEDIVYLKDLTYFLKTIGVDFTMNYKLVRGLDYYTGLVFEFKSKSNSIGSKDTIIGGGRYENMLKDFGGKDIGGIGFGLGVERLINEVKQYLNEEDISDYPEVYVMNLDQETTGAALGIVFALRQSGIKTAWNYKPMKINKAFEKADKFNPIIKIIVGNKDLEKNVVTAKIDQKQSKVKIKNVVEFALEKLGGVINEGHK